MALMGEWGTVDRIPKMVAGVCSKDPSVPSGAKKRVRQMWCAPWIVILCCWIICQGVRQSVLSAGLWHDIRENEGSGSKNSSDSEAGSGKSGGLQCDNRTGFCGSSRRGLPSGVGMLRVVERSGDC